MQHCFRCLQGDTGCMILVSCHVCHLVNPSYCISYMLCRLLMFSKLSTSVIKYLVLSCAISFLYPCSVLDEIYMYLCLLSLYGIEGISFAFSRSVLFLIFLVSDITIVFFYSI